MTRRVSPGLVEAIRFARLPRRKPTDADRPPPSTFVGRKPRHIPGQLELADNDAADERQEGEAA